MSSRSDKLLIIRLFRKHRTSGDRNRFIPWANLVFNLVSAGGVIVAAFIGLEALSIYENANRVQAQNAFYMLDREIYDSAKEKAILEPFWAQTSINVSPRERAIKRLELLSSKEFSKKEWKTIPDLYCLLYGENSFEDKNLDRLRECVGLAERILYLLYAVGDSKRSGIVTDEDYETWLGYLGEIGDHPLFLVAIYNGHFFGYLDGEYCQYLKDKMNTIDWVRGTISEIYPQMNMNGWAQCSGEMGPPSCPPEKSDCLDKKK